MAAWKNKVEGFLGHSLRTKQVEILELLLLKQSVFGVLPTGYGKSICFGAFPAAYEEIHPEEKAIALVISPLNALMDDQHKSWTEKGVSSVILRPLKEMTKDTINAVKDGQFSLMFASPEVVQLPAWWSIIKKLRKKIKLLCFDEGHLISKWGKTFRKKYLRSLELRGILLKIPVLVLTATATALIVAHITTGLGVRTMHTVALSPDRPEIFIKIVSAGPEYSDSFSWYTKLLLEEKENAPRAIIFTRTTNEVINIFFWLNQVLGEERVRDGAFDDPNSRYTEMYHGHTDKESQARVVTNFRQPSSTLRCVVATIAFGLGVDIPNVRYVLHWGAPEDSLAYWQQVGRCARDGGTGTAICYMCPHGKIEGINSPCIIDVVTSRDDISICLRQKVLSYMPLGVNGLVSQPPTTCCYNCQRRESASN